MIIMLDLDDTLLNNEGIISPYTITVLNDVAKRHLVVFNSARSFAATKDLCKLFKPHYQILNGGNTIYNFKDELIYEKPIDANTTNYLIKKLKENYVNTILVESGNGFVTDDLAYLTNHNYANYANLETYKTKSYKIVYHDDNKTIGLKLAKELNLDFTTYINTNINKFCPTTKGNGVQEFRKLFPNEKIIAFGDDLGDLDMLKKADVGIIMANSHKELFNYNFVVTLSNEENGIAYYLKKEGF